MKCTHHFFPEENEHKTCIFSTERNDTNGVTQHKTALGMDATLGDVAKLWALPRPATIPTRHFDSFVLLICWNLWKHRNDVIFRSLPPSHIRFWDACRNEAREWSWRWRREDYTVCDAWCAVFSNM